MTIVTRKNEIKQKEEEQAVYEIPQSEQISSPTLKKKQSVHTNTPIESNIESNNNKQTATDEFFENGPHTNPEEINMNITSSA
jgi:hypothetical protein